MLNNSNVAKYSTFDGSTSKESKHKKWIYGVIGVIVMAMIVGTLLYLQQSGYGYNPSHVGGVVRTVSVSKNSVSGEKLSASDELMQKVWKQKVGGAEISSNDMTVVDAVETAVDTVQQVAGAVEGVAGGIQAVAATIEDVAGNVQAVAATVEDVAGEVGAVIDTVQDVADTVAGTIETIQSGPFVETAETQN